MSGSPDGWSTPFPREVLDAALRWTAPDGNLKLYGGEPTLDPEAVLAALRTLREGGFSGWLTVFSNGILADRLLRILEADDRTEAVLNHSILHGLGVEPLPAAARERLERFAAARPGRIFASHPDLVPVGRGAGPAIPGDSPAFEGRCPRCHPVVTSRGRLRACPFAVESPGSHYDLGDCGLDGREAQARHSRFIGWIEATLEPAAREAGVHPCVLCEGAGCRV